MTAASQGIGLVPPAHHADKKCLWCRRTFTPSPYNHGKPQRYCRAKCGSRWQAKKRKLVRLADHRKALLSAPLDRADDYADTLDVSARVNYETIATQNSQRWTGELALIEDAQRRLDAGLYRVCEGCQAGIPEDRQHYVPWATRCVQCEEKSV